MAATASLVSDSTKSPIVPRVSPPPPPPVVAKQERRQHRPESTADALMRALDCAAERGNLDALLIADREGLLVATSATDVDVLMLAAIAPIVARGRAVANIRKDGFPRELTVEPVQIANELLYVAGLGGFTELRLREVRSSAQATARILQA